MAKSKTDELVSVDERKVIKVYKHGAHKYRFVARMKRDLVFPGGVPVLNGPVVALSLEIECEDFMGAKYWEPAEERVANTAKGQLLAEYVLAAEFGITMPKGDLT